MTASGLPVQYELRYSDWEVDVAVEAPWRNRIVGYGEERVEDLLFNPHNWRVHPRDQQEAIATVMGRIGWVQNVIVNKRTGHLVDGHARALLADRNEEVTVPVTYVDLSEEEEMEVILTFDPLGAMAAVAKDKMAELIGSIDADAEMARLMSHLDVSADFLNKPEMPDGFGEFSEALETSFRCPKCGYEWSGNPAP